MFGRLKCLLGYHYWLAHLLFNAEGPQWYVACTRCHTTRVV